MKIRPFFERLGLVFFGLVLAVFLLEFVLRIASVFFGPRVIESSFQGSRHVILCLGDSHTYGVSYSPDEAYPGQLQARLDHRDPDRYQVINLGIPGMNSSQIRSRLPGLLDQYRASTIIFGAGINNLWNVSDVEETESGGGSGQWIAGLRVYRFYRLLVAAIQDTRSSLEITTERPQLRRSRLRGGKGVVHYDDQTGDVLARHEGNPRRKFSLDHATEMLWKDLSAIHQITQKRGVRLILLTYSCAPSSGDPRFEPHAESSDTMVRFSQEHRVDIIDVRGRFLSLLSGGIPRTWYFRSKNDGHPNPRGYGEIATLAADVILGAESGAVDSR